jgi:hypothetical protein
MERIQFVLHKGKKILYLNLMDAKPPEILQLVREAAPMIAKQPPKSLLTLVDARNMTFDTASTESLKQFAKHNGPYVIAGAVLGVTGLKKIIFNAVLKFSGRNLVAVDSLDQAKDWLVMQ